MKKKKLEEAPQVPSDLEKRETAKFMTRIGSFLDQVIVPGALCHEKMQIQSFCAQMLNLMGYPDGVGEEDGKA